MSEFLMQHYLWLKALHIIAMVAWMAGMFYLPRLFAYHAESSVGYDKAETFKVMERRLLRIIMNPAMIATWLFGILMVVANPDIVQGGWFHAKFALVLGMSALHGVFSKWRKVFERDENKRPPKFYKIWNEVPTVLMIIIVILVVVKPF